MGDPLNLDHQTEMVRISLKDQFEQRTISIIQEGKTGLLGGDTRKSRGCVRVKSASGFQAVSQPRREARSPHISLAHPALSPGSLRSRADPPIQISDGPSLSQQIETLFQRIDTLEPEVQHLGALQQQIEEVQAHFQIEGGQPLLLTQEPLRQQRAALGEPLTKRGLPPGTMPLVNFANVHVIKLSELKRLSMLREIVIWRSTSTKRTRSAISKNSGSPPAWTNTREWSRACRRFAPCRSYSPL